MESWIEWEIFLVKDIKKTPFFFNIEIESDEIHDRFIDSIPIKNTISKIIINLLIEVLIWSI